MNKNTMKAMFAICSHNECYESLRLICGCISPLMYSPGRVKKSLYCAVMIDVISTFRLEAFVCF